MVRRGLSPQGSDSEIAEVAARYAIAVTQDFADLIATDDPEDPIARQVLPDARELNIGAREVADPIGDHAHEPTPGLIHRHSDRVLLKVVSVCPVYCRFCFRREMVGPGKERAMSPDQIEAALKYIRTHSEIWEVILTGGDPFMLSATRAEALTRKIEAIDHVKVIRWHTRMPVADPGRITDDFVRAIASRKKSVFVAVHANHARELSEAAREACGRLRLAGVTLVSQTVLLRSVNDTLETLGALMRAFVEVGIKPYYLHQLDYAPGTSHFRVPLEEARALVRRLRDTQSGLAQPTFVIDIPGGVSKANAALSDVENDGGAVRIRGADDRWRDYPEEDSDGR